MRSTPWGISAPLLNGNIYFSDSDSDFTTQTTSTQFLTIPVSGLIAPSGRLTTHKTQKIPRGRRWPISPCSLHAPGHDRLRGSPEASPRRPPLVALFMFAYFFSPAHACTQTHEPCCTTVTDNGAVVFETLKSHAVLSQMVLVS